MTTVTTPAQLVADISKLDPSNTTLSQWVTDFNTNPALVNEPTQPDIDASVALLQTGEYNLTPTELIDVDTALVPDQSRAAATADQHGDLHRSRLLGLCNGRFHHLRRPGVGHIRPGTVEPLLDATGNLNTAYGGEDFYNVGSDLIKLFENPWGSISAADWAFLADPVSTPDPLNGMQIDGGTNTFGDWLTKLFDGGVSTAPDPAASTAVDSGGMLASMHAELATLLAGMATTAGADATGATGGLFADMAGQFSADLATWFPNLF